MSTFPRRLCGALLGATLLAGCAETPSAPTPTAQRWSATDLDGTALPATAYVFPDEPAPRNVTRIQLDSARIDVDADGRYVRRTWFSEWRSLDPDAGQPFLRVLGFADYDRGELSQAGAAVTLTSGWIQNLVVRGEQVGAGRLRLLHGLTPGDDLLAVGYTQQP